MSSDVQRRIHFINVSNPSVGGVSNARRQARTHSARETHARARRLRVVNYRSRNTDTEQHPHDPRGCNEETATKRDLEDASRTILSTERSTKGQKDDLLSPLNPLPLHAIGQLACFAMSFTPTEYFLLDHCEYLH